MKGFRRGFLAGIAAGAWIVGLCGAAVLGAEPEEADEIGAQTIGPDVIVPKLFGTTAFGYAPTPEGLITAMAAGFSFCNLGTDPIRFESIPSVHHPVMRSSVFRLEDDRLEQIGISWIYHGFYATNDPGCGEVCEPPADADGDLLYPGCWAPEGSQSAGHRSNLSAASRVNAHLGQIIPPMIPPEPSSVIHARLQVHNADLDRAVHPNARYYVEVQALSSDDAAAGNGNNNASHQRVIVRAATDSPEDDCSGTDPEKYCFSLLGSLYEGQPGIRAWKNYHPAVVETDVQVPGEGLFIVAAKATDVGAGYWQYEYAIQNLNSDRSGGSFSLPLPYGVSVHRIGFHDVDYHSGEPFSGEDWQSEWVDHSIRWSTEEYSMNVNANSLRWGTMYNFRFVCDAPPGTSLASLGLFKPGSPESVSAWTTGPAIDPDTDGDFDLRDYANLLTCFSGSPDDPNFEVPDAACLRNFDQDQDYAVDLLDTSQLRILSAGPS